MNGDAIHARFGLDLTGMTKSAAEAESIVKGAHKRMAAGAHENSEAHEHLLGSTHRVARQIGSFSQVLLSGGDAASVFVAAMEGVERSLHLPLGALAGLAIGAIVAEEIHKVTEEATKLRSEIDQIYHRSAQGSDFSSLEDLKGRLEEVRKQTEKLKEEEGDGSWGSAIGSFSRDWANAVGKIFQGDFSNLNPLREVGEGSIDRDKESNAEKLTEARKRVLDGIAEKEQSIADISRTRLTSGDHEAELEKIAAEFAEKRGAVYKEIAQHGEDHEKEIEALRDQERLAVETENRKHEAAGRAEELEARILAIRMSQRDVAVEIAKAQVEDAEVGVRKAVGDKKDAAKNKLSEAQLAQRDAEKARDKELRDAEEQLALLDARATHNQAWIDQKELEVQFDEKIRLAQEAQKTQLVTLLQHERDRTAELREQQRIKAMRESNQLSVQDIAEHGSGAARAKAREIMRLEGRSREEALSGNMVQSDKFAARARTLKDSFEALKDSDKDPEHLLSRAPGKKREESLDEAIQPRLAKLMKPMGPHDGHATPEPKRPDYTQYLKDIRDAVTHIGKVRP